jgi:hypothetical protein
MNKLHKSLPDIAPNNVTLMLGESTGRNTEASLAHALELVAAQPSASVVYINTVLTTRSMYELARRYGLEPKDNGICIVNGDQRKIIYIVNITRGDLWKWRDTIREYLYMGYVQSVIINSWEFSSRNSRYREEAIFFLKEITDGTQGGYQPVNALVYAEEIPNGPLIQKMQRGGFGKLSALANKIHNITLKQTFERESDVRSPKSEVGEIVLSQSLSNDPLVREDSELAGLMSDVEEAIKESCEVRSSQSDVKEEAASDMEVHLAPVFVPRSNLGRRTSDFPRNPIHLNNRKPDKAPAVRIYNSRTPSPDFGHQTSDVGLPPNVHSDVIKE